MQKDKTKKILDDFLLEMQTANKSRNTIVNYKSDLINFLNKYPAGIENLTVEILREHFTGLSHKSPTTRARNISSLKKFLDWCYKKDFIPDNPLLKIERGKQNISYTPKKIEKAEIEKIIYSIKETNLKYRLIFTLMLEAGLKANEVLNLKYENIEKNTQTIFINHDSSRRIPLFSPEPIRLFNLYAEKTAITSGFLFAENKEKNKTLTYQALNKFWRNLCTNANTKIKLQQLRDCYAKELVERGLNLCIISQMLGHKNIQTTVKYLS